MTATDLPLVLKWRNSDRIRSMMYTDHMITLAEHTQWFERACARKDASHLVFVLEGNSVGVVNISAIDTVHRHCHWGFYLGATDVPKGAGTAMGVLTLELMFGELSMHKVIGEVLSFNEASVNYHKKLGFVEEGRLRDHVFKAGKYEDVITLAHFADRWQAISPELTTMFTEQVLA